MTIKEGNGDAADKETKANNSRDCFTTTLKGGTSTNPGEHIATTKEPINGGIAAVKEMLTTYSTTETTPSKVGINCNNELGVGNEGRITDIRECSSHDHPTKLMILLLGSNLELTAIQLMVHVCTIIFRGELRAAIKYRKT